MDSNELRTMILDYMGKGFLENIIDMFKHDESLCPLIIDMIRDERIRVRLGATALVEDLVQCKRERLVLLIPEIAELLKDTSPTVRGDAAYLLGIIGHEDGLPFLSGLERDADSNVREIARESVKEIITGSL